MEIEGALGMVADEKSVCVCVCGFFCGYTLTLSIHSAHKAEKYTQHAHTTMDVKHCGDRSVLVTE